MLATGHTLDSGGDSLVALVHVIRSKNRNATARLIHTDGDGFAVIQGDGQRVGDVGHRRAVFIHKAGGVNDIAAFANGGSGGQNNIDLVDGVVDRGGRTVACNFQFFEVAASSLSNLDGLGALIDKHVIGRRGHSHGANSVAGLDGDRRAVIQLQGDVSTGLVAQGCRVGDLTTFINGTWCSQCHSRGVVCTRGVRNGGVHRRSARYQILEMLAAGYAFDGGSDSLIALVHIIRRDGGDRATRLIYPDGYGLAVVQSHGQRIGDVSHRRTVFIHKASGVDDVAAFANGVGGGQNYIHLVDGVVDRGGRTVACNFQFFEVAAGSVGDLDGLGALVDEDVIGRRWHGHSADGIASFDSDRRTVVQLQRNVSARFVGKCGGVRNLTTFVHCARRG